jgi:hypothetical protein
MRLYKTAYCILLLFTFYYYGAAQSCVSRPPFSGYSFINANIIDGDIAGALQLIDMEGLEQYYEQKGDLQVKTNKQEWFERFCEAPLEKDVEFLIYYSSIEDLEGLRTAILSPSRSIGIRLSDNTFADYLHKHQCLETVEYLIFAKTCEPYVTRTNPWTSENRAQSTMIDLITEGEKKLQKSKSHYIKLRYAYQIIRLAHYSRQYELALELYDNLLPSIKNDPSIIEDWIEGHRAGVLMAQGDTVEASYIFSRVFERSPAKRNSAYQSFRIKTDQQWQKCLYLCKNDREKATLYAIRGSFPDSKLLIEMKNIYAHDPSSNYLSLFLVREMKKLEKHLLGTSFNDKRSRNKRYYGIPAPEAGKKIVGLQQFVTQVLKEGLVEDPGLWWLADGYLSVLSGNFYDARESFKEADKLIKRGIKKEQLEVFKLVLQILAYQVITSDIEEELGYIMRYNDYYLRYEDFTDFTEDKLTQLYLQNGNIGKAFLMQYPFDYLKPNPQPEMVEDLITVCRKPELTILEQEMVAAGDSTILEDLLNLKATYLMSLNRHEAALATYKLIKRVDWDNYGVYAPFQERIGECIKCPLPPSARLYNKGEILEQILEMEYSAKAGTVDVGNAYYRIGTALYNMTYFGHAWEVADFFRSGISLNPVYLEDGNDVIPHRTYPYGNKENFDCSRARYYFEKARIATDSVELAAKATFMAAKCERNEYYVNRWNPEAVQTFENFQILIETYYRTEFFRQILQECRYLNAYANRYYELD